MSLSVAHCYLKKEKATVLPHPGSWTLHGDRRTEKCGPSATQTNAFKPRFPQYCETRAL